MRILIACEESQVVTRAFREAGHEAFSCDLQPAALEPRWHIQGDAREAIRGRWDMAIAHPMCDRLTNSGVRWLAERDLWDEMREGCAFFNVFRDAHHIPKRVIENPIPHKYAVALIGKYHQLYQPHHFGAPQLKATCLWLYGVPKLVRTHWMQVPKAGTPERRAWSAVWMASPGPNRKRERSRTLPPVAAAFAAQWGGRPDLAMAAE